MNAVRIRSLGRGGNPSEGQYHGFGGDAHAVRWAFEACVPPLVRRGLALRQPHGTKSTLYGFLEMKGRGLTLDLALSAPLSRKFVDVVGEHLQIIQAKKDSPGKVVQPPNLK